MEALQNIFDSEEFVLRRERPYQFEILLNSNSETEENNHLKLKLIFDLPRLYPDETPTVRIKNLAETYINTTLMYMYEEDIKHLSAESLGCPMVFDICNCIKG